MSRIGLIDVDGHNGFPNIPLMKIASYHKRKGDEVEWHDPIFGGNYDVCYKSKVFTFSPDYLYPLHANKVVKGGTGYDIKSVLPPPIEAVKCLDYSIYPSVKYSVQFYSRGCIRSCWFCCVSRKEGKIHPVEPMELNPHGEWIEVLDNDFFANPEWRSAVEDLERANQPVKFHGVDVRIMDEEQAYWLNRLPLKTGVHVAWDSPQIDLTDRLKAMLKHIKPYKITCYVLIGPGSTKEQDLFRLRTLKELGILPFVQPYRDFENKRKPTKYELDLARWANRAWLFKSCDFLDFSPRKGFKCNEYFK